MTAPRRLDRVPRVPFLVLALGLALTAAAFAAMQSLEHDRVHAHLDAVAEQRMQIFLAEVARSGEVLSSLKRFYGASNEVTADEFRAFLEGVAASNPFLVAVYWAPRVPAAERAAQERALAAAVVPSRGIWEVAADSDASPGGRRSASARAVHYPIAYQVSLSGTNDLRGLDLASLPERALVIEQALRTGRISASQHGQLLPIHGLGTDELVTGFAAFLPARLGTPRDRGEADGVLGIVVRTDLLLAGAFRNADPAFEAVSLRDESVPGDAGVSLGLRTAREPRMILGALRERGGEAERAVEKTWSWGGRTWRLKLIFAPDAVRSAGRNDPYYVLLVGVIGSLLLSAALAYHAVRRRRDEESERARNLRLERRRSHLLELGLLPFGRNLAESLDQVCAAAVEAMELDGAEAWLVGSPGRRMSCLAGRSRGERISLPEPWDLDRAPAYAAALASGAALSMTTEGGDPLATGLPDRTVHASDGRLDVPVRRGGAVAGVLTLRASGARTWTQEDVTEAISLAEFFSARLEEHERRQAEVTLRESRKLLQRGEERLRLTIEHAPIGIGSLSSDGRFLRANRVLAAVLGVLSDKLIGQSLLEFVAEHDRLAVGALLARLATGEAAARDLEFRIVRPGAEAVVSGRFAMVRESDGSAGEIVVQIEEITERKRADLALRESEMRYRGIFESVADGLVVAGLDGLIRDLNPASQALLGWRIEDLRGMPLSRILAEECRAVLERARAAVLQGTSFSADLVAHRRDGSLIPVDARFSPFEHEGFQAFLVSLRDISERKAAEEERRRFLQQEHEARAAAEQAVRARDTFLSVASHELRTPLTVLQLNLQGLQAAVARLAGAAAGENEALSKFVAASLRQGERLNHFVEVLLDTTRIASGQFGLKRERVDLARVVRDVLERLAEAFTRAKCPVSLSAPIPIWGHWDRFRLEQVVTNLLTNAARYGYGKPVKIRVRGDGDGAVLEVEDEGMGIAPQDQERIFRKYERVAAGPHRGGLGLGLYIVREIVEAHGGDVRLESAAGRGSLFRVRLPFPGDGLPGSESPESGPADSPASTAPSSPPLFSIAAGGLEATEEASDVREAKPASAPTVDGTILVVEDDGDIRMLLCELIQDAGYRSVEARDGKEALEALERGIHPRLILLDLMMPVMDGREFRKAQLRRPEWAGIPVILVSADQRARERCADLEFAAFLSKPVASRDLLDAVRRILEGK